MSVSLITAAQWAPSRQLLQDEIMASLHTHVHSLCCPVEPRCGREGGKSINELGTHTEFTDVAT